MNRRRLLQLLGATAAVATVSPTVLWAATADELAGKAQELLTSGQTAKAVALLLEAEGKDARNDRVQALLGRAFFQQGDARAALQHFSMAVRINPEDTLSRMMVETINQFPLPPLQAGGQKREGMGRARLSSLEREAQAERQTLLNREAAPKARGPLRVLIDPGHGGSEPGATADGLRESDVALDLGLRLARLFSSPKDDMVISLTRTADVTLPNWARAALSGFYGADLLVSLHATRVPERQAAGVGVYSFAQVASDPVAQGAATSENTVYGRQSSVFGQSEQAFFLTAARQSAGIETLHQGTALAARMVKALPASSPLPLRGAGAGPFRLLAEAYTPAILVEAGFLSHPDDAAALASPEKRQALAQALATGLQAALHR